MSEVRSTNKVAAAGAQANQSVPSGRFPIPPAVLHQALNQAFGDALHGMFIISGIAVLAAALLAAFSLQQGQARTSGEGVSSQATTATQGAVAVNAEER